MTYYVYENWQAEGHKARVHFSDCSFCNEGRGIHPGASEENGRWHGPFPALSEALQFARSTRGRVSQCKKCHPE